MKPIYAEKYYSNNKIVRLCRVVYFRQKYCFLELS